MIEDLSDDELERRLRQRGLSDAWATSAVARRDEPSIAAGIAAVLGDDEPGPQP